MSGRELALSIAASRPETKVLYMTGYTDGAIAEHGVLETGISMLRKPFTQAQLIRSLDGIFEAHPDADAPANLKETAEERPDYAESRHKNS